jgi:transposase InsO family protein
MHNQLEYARKFGLLNVIDDFNREAIGMEVEFHLPFERVIRELKRIISWRGKSQVIPSDNGPEYIRSAIHSWASGASGWNTFSRKSCSRMLMSSSSTGRCDTSGCYRTSGITWQRF